MGSLVTRHGENAAPHHGTSSANSSHQAGQQQFTLSITLMKERHIDSSIQQSYWNPIKQTEHIQWS